MRKVITSGPIARALALLGADAIGAPATNANECRHASPYSTGERTWHHRRLTVASAS